MPEETAVALVHDAATTAVLMATPLDLEDLLMGFSLTEGVISRPSDIADLEIVPSEHGVEARAWLRTAAGAEAAKRRRSVLGPTGCGLCGVESLSAALRPPPIVGEGLQITRAQVHAALRDMTEAQGLAQRTRAVHAAALWSPTRGVLALREDVGRHNALDKVVGVVARRQLSAGGAMVVLTSRVSVEMVQKAAFLQSQVIVAVSAPTALAVRTAQAAGLTLIAVARDDGFEVFSRPDRVRAQA